MSDARLLAAQVLLKMERDGAYSSLLLNAALKAQADMPPQDRALATMLVYGVLERRVTLDYNLALYLKQPLKKLHPGALVCLRLGAYQLLFADRIPTHSAVNESVKLTRAVGAGFAAGMINAVLRKVAAAGLCLPCETDINAYLSVKYACPQPLLAHFLENYGPENTASHLAASLGERPLFVRCNPLACTPETFMNELEKDGVAVREHTPQGCCVLENAGDVTALSAYKKGWFHVQDRSSQLAALLLDVKPGQTVADCCAAPGGKSFTLAQQMQNTGTLYACDIHPHKTALIEAGAKRLGLTNIRTVCADAVTLYDRGILADAVLCDVPCSGLGVIGRKPEIRYKAPSSFAELPQTQFRILSSCARMVKPGGALVYSTCTLNPAENEGVAERFLASDPRFSVDQNAPYTVNGLMTVFASADGGDGFFAVRFVRAAE